jgi:3-isopropylmalate dehydrogenase
VQCRRNKLPGLRTTDIKSEGTTVVSTTEMGEAVVGELERLTA